MSEVEKKVKEKFVKALEIPKEMLLNVPRITMIGDEDIYVENYKGIIEYDETLIRLGCNLNIYGSKLNIEEITTDEIFITGKFNNIEFE